MVNSYQESFKPTPQKKPEIYSILEVSFIIQFWGRTLVLQTETSLLQHKFYVI